MALKTYIGARYAPRFMGAWDESVSYQPICVVYYNNNSYVSKKDVPAGTPVTDEQYWIISSEWNAQVSQYQKQVEEYKTITDANTQKTEEYKNTTDTYKEQSKYYFEMTFHSYNTQADMVADTSIKEGYTLITCGKEYIGDGKGRYFKVVSETSSDAIALQNGLWAKPFSMSMTMYDWTEVTPAISGTTETTADFDVGNGRYYTAINTPSGALMLTIKMNVDSITDAVLVATIKKFGYYNDKPNNLRVVDSNGNEVAGCFYPQSNDADTFNAVINIQNHKVTIAPCLTVKDTRGWTDTNTVQLTVSGTTATGNITVQNNNLLGTYQLLQPSSGTYSAFKLNITVPGSSTSIIRLDFSKISNAKNYPVTLVCGSASALEFVYDKELYVIASRFGFVNVLSGDAMQYNTLEYKIQQQITNLNTVIGKVNTNTSNIDTINGDISTINSEINTLSGTIDAVNSAVNVNTQKINTVSKQATNLGLDMANVLYPRATSVTLTPSSSTANVNICTGEDSLNQFITVYLTGTTDYTAKTATINLVPVNPEAGARYTTFIQIFDYTDKAIQNGHVTKLVVNTDSILIGEKRYNGWFREYTVSADGLISYNFNSDVILGEFYSPYINAHLFNNNTLKEIEPD